MVRVDTHLLTPKVEGELTWVNQNYLKVTRMRKNQHKNTTKQKIHQNNETPYTATNTTSNIISGRILFCTAVPLKSNSEKMIN